MQVDNVEQQDEDIFSKLVSFVRDQFRIYKKKIDRDTLVEDRLGITGDDAEELIVNYGKKFNVNISEFDFGKYFYSEIHSLISPSKRVEPFTIGYLEKGIIAGRLDEEVINK